MYKPVDHGVRPVNHLVSTSYSARIVADAYRSGQGRRTRARTIKATAIEMLEMTAARVDGSTSENCEGTS